MNEITKLKYDFDFFISYSHDIKPEIIENLIFTFDIFNIKIWIDKNYLYAGTLLSETLDEVLAITNKKLGAIILIDKTYLFKEWCLKELDYFIKNNIKLFIFCIECYSDFIFHNKKELLGFNIISFDECITCNQYYDLIVTNILCGLLINKENSTINIEKVLCKDTVLFNLIQDYIGYNDIISIIVKSQTISNWILYSVYKEMKLKKGVFLPNKKVLLESEYFPRLIKIIINYIDYYYNQIFLINRIFSNDITTCLKLCVNSLIFWYYSR